MSIREEIATLLCPALDINNMPESDQRKYLLVAESIRSLILKGKWSIPDGEGGYYYLGHRRKTVERPDLIIKEV